MFKMKMVRCITKYNIEYQTGAGGGFVVSTIGVETGFDAPCLALLYI
jgi:hypothetical protein